MATPTWAMTSQGPRRVPSVSDTNLLRNGRDYTRGRDSPAARTRSILGPKLLHGCSLASCPSRGVKSEIPPWTLIFEPLGVVTLQKREKKMHESGVTRLVRAPRRPMRATLLAMIAILLVMVQ